MARDLITTALDVPADSFDVEVTFTRTARPDGQETTE
jgi:hypothetical protein